MKWIDISRELFSAPVYEGDPYPELEPLQRLAHGDGYNLSMLHACLHNGTHIDAPLHMLEDGASIDRLPPDVFMGECRVACFSHEIITGTDIEGLGLRGMYRRLLIRGNGRCALSRSGAYVLADEGLLLVGIDAPTIGIPTEDILVHRILFESGAAILEGLDLSRAPAGNYDLYAAPLNLAGAEAAPCRAFLRVRSISL